MDGRTQKRIASVQHIKTKPYYKSINEEPDPVFACSSRHWKWQMKTWVEKLKSLQTCDEDQLPQREEDAVPDVMMAGSQ